MERDLPTFQFDRQIPGHPPQQQGRNLADWNVDDVSRFIEATCRTKFGNEKCDAYKRLVVDNDVDGEILAEMTDQQLQKLGISSFGHRHYILKRIQALASPGGEKVEVSPSNSASTGSMYYHSHGSNAHRGGPGGPTQDVGARGPMGTGGIRTSEVPAHTGFSKPAQPRLHHPTPRIHESQVTIGRKIGSGSVGYVYEGKYEQHPVAIKKHKTDGTMMDHKALQEFEIEVGKMTAVNHPCIVRCYGMLDPSPGIVMELVQGGALFQILHGERGETYDQYKQRLPWQQRLRYLLDAMYGLRAVHNANLIHGDFKTLNLLVERDQRVKVADFGLSKVLDALSVLPGTKTITGTPQYMAPEVMLTQPQGMRVDIYSAAIVMWEILTGSIPWKGMDIVQIIHQVTQDANKTQKPPPGRPRLDAQHIHSSLPGYVQLMHECWAQFPNERPSTDQCVQQLEAIQLAMRGGWSGVNNYHQRMQNPNTAAYQMDQQRSNQQGGAQAPQQLAPQYQRVQHPPDKRPRLGDPGLNMPQWQSGQVAANNQDQRGMMPPPTWGGARGMPGAASNQPGSGVGPSGGGGGASLFPMQRSLAPPPMFLAAGGMDVLVDMMQNSDPANQKQAAQVVFEACNDNPTNQQLVKDAGGVQRMVQMLQADNTPEVKTKAADAIAAACAQNRDNRVEALQANALEPLVRMLEAGNVQTQESAANALANVIIPRVGGGINGPDGDNFGSGDHGDKKEIVEGQNALNDLGGVTKLIHLVENGAPRVKEAAAAAIANAMVDNQANRQAFQEAGGVGPLISLLKSGDLQAQEHATTALWNAMVDNEQTKNDLIQHPQGLQVLVQVLSSGTEVTQESAAGAIWKACVADPTIKDRLFVAIPGLVQLLKKGSPGAQTQAAGALRSACINSVANKKQLNRFGGISALVECIRSGVSKAREQAGAALANACANSVENQNAARHTGAMQVLVDMLKNSDTHTEMLEIAAAAIRNLCGNSLENSEELHRCGGIAPLLFVIRNVDSRPALREYAVGALWKACVSSEENIKVVCATGIQHIENELQRDDCSEDMKRCVMGLLSVLRSTDNNEDVNHGHFGVQPTGGGAVAQGCGGGDAILVKDEKCDGSQEEAPSASGASNASASASNSKPEEALSPNEDGTPK